MINIITRLYIRYSMCTTSLSDCYISAIYSYMSYFLYVTFPTALTKCSDSCVLGGGCLGPEEDPSLCGECYVTDDVDSCSVVERPSESGLSCPGWWPPTEDPFRTLFILVVSVGVAIIVLVVVLICVVYCICKRNFGEERKGGYFVSGDHRVRIYVIL